MSDADKLLLKQILQYNFMLMGITPDNADIGNLLTDLEYFIDNRQLPVHMIVAAESIRQEQDWLHGQRLEVLQQRIRQAQAAYDAELNLMHSGQSVAR
jgi:hypothetical protein